VGDTTSNAVVSFRPMIKRMAAKLAAKLPADIQIDDLMQEGVIGLINAVRQCRVKDERFTAYAYHRIQGAMLDSLRAMDTAPADMRRRVREANVVVATLEQKLGRRPFESEIAAELGVDLNDYQRLLFDVYSLALLHFDPTDESYSEVFGVIDEGADPVERSDRRRLIENIDWAIEGLPERQCRVIRDIYINGVSAGVVAQALHLTEGRISQIRKEALGKIRDHLRQRGLLPD
jgi:RNA polymerase sigma factor for flagellar operon FliA